MANSAISDLCSVVQTLHLRFCCHNTGKRTLREKKAVIFDKHYMQDKECLPVSFPCLNAFLLKW